MASPSLNPVEIRSLVSSNDISEIKTKVTELASSDSKQLSVLQQQQRTKVRVVLWNRILQLQQLENQENVRKEEIIESHEAIAKCWMDLGEHDKAIAQLALALETEPDSLTSLQLVGQALVSTGEFAQALKAQERVLFLQKEGKQDTTKSRIQIAAVYEARGEFDKAIDALKQAETSISHADGLDSPPDKETRASLYEEMGKLYNLKGQYAEAVSALAKSREILVQIKGENDAQTQQVTYLLEMSSSLMD